MQSPFSGMEMLADEAFILEALSSKGKGQLTFDPTANAAAIVGAVRKALARKHWSSAAITAATRALVAGSQEHLIATARYLCDDPEQEQNGDPE